jgi:hypothetical protein
MATYCYITAATISIPNPVRTGDPFSVTFTYHADNLLPENFTYNVYAMTESGEPTKMAEMKDIWGSYLVPKTVTMSCNGINCGYKFEPTLPGGTPIAIALEVVADGTPEGYARHTLKYITTAVDNGYLSIEDSNLPTQVTPLQEVPVAITIRATGNPVYSAMAGIYQVDGPKIQIKISDYEWADLPTNPLEPIYTSTINEISNAAQSRPIVLKMPDAGWILDPNAGKTATIGIVAARRNSIGVAIIYQNGIRRTTFIKNSGPITCVENSEQCFKADGTLGGCIKKVCHSNTWIKISDNDPTCANCGPNNHTCLGKSGLQVPAGTRECEHPNACSRYTCNGVTSAWDLTTAVDTTCGTGTQCATPVCTNGQTSCDPTFTHGTPCTKYGCVGGQWMKSLDQGIMDCGATCAVKNPIVIGGIAAGVVGIAVVYYLMSSRPSASRTSGSRGR